MTIDPLETRGFDYHHGIGFAIFAPGVRGELGRGGRYRTSAIGGDAEESTGVTLYLERVLRAIPALAPKSGFASPIQPALLPRRQVDDGHVVFGAAAADSVAAMEEEARSLGCTHILEDGVSRPLGD